MNRPLIIVSLCLGLAAVLAGCASPTPEPQANTTDTIETAAAPLPVHKTEAAPVETGEPSPARIEPNDIDLPVASPQVPVEPSEPNEPEEGLSMAEPNPVVIGEPVAAVLGEPNGPFDPEPNVPAMVEPDALPKAPPAPPGTEALAAFYNRYAQLLRTNVRPDGRVDYATLRRRKVTIQKLLDYPDNLDPSVYSQWSQETKLAFWINVYNLKMLDVIARNHPIQSSWWLRLTWPPSDIRHIDGIWSDYRFIVMNEEFTLETVERRLLSRTFGDPRAFLAIHYAARSAPPLRPSPYRAETLDRQLDEQVRAFLTSSRGIRIDEDKNVVSLSALFKPTWHGGEFVARYGTDKRFKSYPPQTPAVLNFITQYLPAESVHYLEVEGYTLEYMNFDWRLNDASRDR